jgi:two-component system, OmpR family, heavy metal sensor histidine kinase CusS
VQHLNRISLTQRLTLMFVAAATTVLLMLGWVVARSVEQHFMDLDMEVLTGKLELIREGLQSVTSPEDLLPFTHRLAYSLVGHPGLEVVVMDADHNIIFATAHANFSPDLVLSGAAQMPAKSAIWQLGEQAYRGMAAQMPTAALDKSGYRLSVIVAVATDMAHHQMYMRSFMQTLWLFVVIASGLSGALGWLAVRRGLAPLRTMREQAQGVTAQQLNQRLPVNSVPPELADLAESLNDMLARLEQAFARLSDFSSDIAHELRTPVSNLMTQTQVALSQARSADAYRDILASNAEELERMARMISDMLLLAKADNGLAVPDPQTLDLGLEVHALFDFYDAVAEEKGLKLLLEGSSQVQADRLMLRRALGNLLSNAIRHASPATVVQVTLSSSAEAVSIAVANHGETLTPAILERVFDRFFRGDPSRHRNQDGTGLGLTITRSIVMAHGGEITATSSNGLTTFTITLPSVALTNQIVGNQCLRP